MQHIVEFKFLDSRGNQNCVNTTLDGPMLAQTYKKTGLHLAHSELWRQFKEIADRWDLGRRTDKARDMDDT